MFLVQRPFRAPSGPLILDGPKGASKRGILRCFGMTVSNLDCLWSIFSAPVAVGTYGIYRTNGMNGTCVRSSPLIGRR